MPKLSPIKEIALVSMLNDLLKLDHDAVLAYTIAIRAAKTRQYQDTLRRFRADHERHIDKLADLVLSHGGTPVELPHLPTGAFKLAVQSAGAAAGDTALLLAFKANERQVRDKYRRAARRTGLPRDVAGVIARAAVDEIRHYDWAASALQQRGTAARLASRAEVPVELGHARMADMMEGVEKQGVMMAESVARGVKGSMRSPGRAALVAASVGGAAVAATMLARKGRH